MCVCVCCRRKKGSQKNNETFYLLRLCLETFAFLFLTFAVCTVFGVSSVEQIPPSKGGGVVADESLVVVVVMLSTSPEGNPVVKRPREIVARVGINGLEKTENDPKQHGSQMEIPLGTELQNMVSDKVVDQWTANGAKAQDHCLDRMSVLGRNTKGRSVFVVNLVHLLVKRRPVHEPVHVIVVKVLKDEKDGQLR